MKKRLLSAMLALVMVLALLPGTAQAAGGDVVYPVAGGNIYFNKDSRTITKCDNTVTEAIIPLKIEDTPVKAIAPYAFSFCGKLTKVIIPVGVTTIGSYAFSDCGSLSSITIPETVTSVGEYVFWHDDALKTAGPRADGFNYNIKYDWTLIPSNAFHACDGLTKITLSNSVTDIGTNVFLGLSNLSAIEVEFGNPAFCSKDGVLFSKDMKKLIAFPQGKGMQYQIPNGVENIADYAFFSTKLASITLPESVSSVGLTAFSSSFLLQFNVSGDNKSFCAIDGVLFSRNQKTLVAYPGGKGKTYRIPDGVTTIADGAFYGWYSGSITIPVSVTKIGYVSFGLFGPGTINYCGTEEQWRHISIDSRANTGLDSATIHYNYSDNGGSSGVPSNPGQGGTKKRVILAKFKAIDVFTNTVFFYDGTSYQIADNANLNINGLVNQWVACEIQETLQGDLLLSVKPANISQSKRIIITSIPDIAYKGKKLAFINGTYESYSAFEIPIEITIRNEISMPNPYPELLSDTIPSEWIECLRADPSLDYTITNVSLEAPKGFNFGMLNGGMITIDKSLAIHVNQEKKLTGYLRADSSYVPSDKINKYSVTGYAETSDGRKDFSIPFSIHDMSSVEEQTSDQLVNDAANKLEDLSIDNKIVFDVALMETLGISGDMLDLFRREVLTEIILSNTPEKTLKETLSDKVLEKVFSYKPALSASAYTLPLVYSIKTPKYGEVVLRLECSISDFKISGSRYALSAPITYEIISSKKALPYYVAKTGKLGMVNFTDVKEFADAAYKVAEKELKEQFNKVWGDSANKVAEFLFDKTVTKILKAYDKTYKSVIWALITKPSKNVKNDCPTNVYIYDTFGHLCGAIENGKVTKTSEDFQLSVVGETKYITGLTDDYTVKYVATGNGTMDVEVSENYGDDIVCRKVIFSNVPLHTGGDYTQTITADLLPAVEQYNLTSENNVIIKADKDEILPDTETDEMGFVDVNESDWFYDSVSYVASENLMNGKTRTIFAPNDTATRAEVATVLWRMDDCLQANLLLKYSDVPGNTWYTEAVRWATAAKVVNGYSSTKFGPGDQVTREQFATMLYRYAAYLDMDVTAPANALAKFQDVGTVSSWARNAMAWAVDQGIINGIDGKLVPQGSAVRAQLAAMIERFSKLEK